MGTMSHLPCAARPRQSTRGERPRFPRFAGRLLPLLLVLLGLTTLFADRAPAQSANFAQAIEAARRALDVGNLDGAQRQIERALERDAASLEAWRLRVRWAEAAGRRDELVHAKHRLRSLAAAQGASREELSALDAALHEIDPLAREWLAMRALFVSQLVPIAERYERDGRRHSAIRTHREILAIDPERSASVQAIERIASAPDPSLAADAKPRDLLDGVSSEWISAFDRRHVQWRDRARLERPNYVTVSNAGYEVMVRSAEAMEQMNAFYRVFFQYGMEGQGRSVPRIELRIFRNRDDYLRHGSNPPEWSGGLFTGSAVETFIGPGGFEEMVGTLFHEAAHQFISLATNAVGWLNEGLASFFEGCRLLANGTVLMNLPANHRLFPLAQRMEAGWMSDENDGIDPANPTGSQPERAPTFRIVLENRYTWGPPWYAPTWGVVYFLYNFQDPLDGRFVYRAAFRQFIDRSGGRMGPGAVRNFEEVVLANPEPPTPGVDTRGRAALRLPRTVEELDEVWKQYILELRDEQSGRREVQRPWLEWARHARTRRAFDDAFEHFEKGLAEHPNDLDLLIEFADLLRTQRRDDDRAAKLLAHAARVLERSEPVDTRRLAEVERALERADPGVRDVARVRNSIRTAATGLVRRYVAEELHLMAMDLSLGLGTSLGIVEMEELYADAVRRSGKTLALWSLAYNEENLEGWTSAGQEGWTARGERLEARLGTYRPDTYEYRFLTLDQVTSGDFSMEAEVLIEPNRGAFAGLVFGRKSADSFHAAILFPPRAAREGAAETAYVDLTSFYGPGSFQVWRHLPVGGGPPAEGTGTASAGGGRKLRVDVIDRHVDLWVDGVWQASHEFASPEILRGGFGLILGPGEAAFRNVRFLARDSRDFGGALERQARMESMAEGGRAPGGSYLGFEAPWPEVARWVGGSPRAWEDLGRGPKLLVLWSVDQNDAMPLDAWLRDLVERHAQVDLGVMSIVSANDAEGIEGYLERNAFPGPVGVDAREGFGIGTSFELFAIDRFNLPRLLLLDPDGRVVWEGDPGLRIGDEWAGEETYLDAPLADLIERRRLRELLPWRARYRAEIAPALSEGRFDEALPGLLEAQTFDGRSDPLVAEAQARLALARAAASDLESAARTLIEADAAPAIAVLLAWAEALDVAPSPQARRTLRPLLERREARDWGRALDRLESQATQLRRRRATQMESTAEAFAAAGERFGVPAAERVRALGETPDPDEVEALAEELRRVPERWLAAQHFGW